MATATLTSFAQTSANDDYVKAFENLPAFKISTVPDSSLYTNNELNKSKPVVMMFFSPDCEHCQLQVKEFMAYKNELKDIQFVMISALPYKDNLGFYNEYNIAAFPNFKLGIDNTYKLRLLYRITTFPSMFVYDSRAKLAKAFVGNVGSAAIIDAVK